MLLNNQNSIWKDINRIIIITLGNLINILETKYLLELHTKVMIFPSLIN